MAFLNSLKFRGDNACKKELLSILKEFLKSKGCDCQETQIEIIMNILKPRKKKSRNSKAKYLH